MNAIVTGEGRSRITKAIAGVEKRTSAEIVAVLRETSGSYRHADLAFGALLALALLCVFLYHPEEFDFTWLPLEQAATFVLGALACAYVPPLRRALSGAKTRETNVRTAARATFVELGVSATKRRTGILVYLASFERDAALVCDVGIDPKALGDELESAERALREAMRAGHLDDLANALDRLGDALAKAYPVSADDVDELPNEVAA